ncbi:MAG: formate dehydrogenase accessory sulfurtransferase FdhD [Aristaeellaceae bacterium]
MHVFLTGDRQVGKSTAVRAIVRALGLPVKGFVSDFAQGGHGGSLFLMPADQPPRMDECHLVARREQGRMTAHPGRFDQIGVPLLEEAMRCSGGLILMDEIGHLEQDAAGFRDAIRRCLDGRTPVLGVLRRDVPWHDAIKHHPHVRVLTVTQENREQIPHEAIDLLTQELPKGRMLTEALVPWCLNGRAQSALLCSPDGIPELLTGMLLSTMSILTVEEIIRITEENGCWQVSTRSAAPQLPLEERLPRLPLCASGLTISRERALQLLDKLMEMDNSSGLHTVMLTMDEHQIVCRDIGRHNALDKAIGSAVRRGLPLSRAVMCTSGRISIEMLAKAAAVGIPILCTCKQVGDLAEKTAARLGIAIVQHGRASACYGAQHRVRETMAL